MSKEVYFDYGSRIESKRMAEAIAVPNGVGPICGFGSASINGNTLTVYPYGIGDNGGVQDKNFKDPANGIIRDGISARHIPKASDSDLSDYRITFSCIAKDGIIFRSGDSQISNIAIEGNQGTYEEVLLFAEHRYVSEPVNNMVSFRAFWNESSFSFFSLYKRSLDVYYPSSVDIRKPSISDNNDPLLDNTLTYNYLISKVEAACSVYNVNQKSLVLIGIYGKGINDSVEGRSENFALVPYFSKFPCNIPYNMSLHSYFRESLRVVEEFVDISKVYNNILDPNTGEYLSFKTLPSYLEWLIDQKISSLQKQVELMALPNNSIILYDGDAIPKGWQEYSAAAGRVVIGYTAGGILLNTTDGGNQTVLLNLGDTYDPVRADDRYQITIKGEDLPQHFHGIGIGAGKMANKREIWMETVTNFNERRTEIEGQMWNWDNNWINNVVQGALLSGANITDPTDPISETKTKSLTFSKLPPAITLRYIKKVSYAE